VAIDGHDEYGISVYGDGAIKCSGGIESVLTVRNLTAEDVARIARGFLERGRFAFSSHELRSRCEELDRTVGRPVAQVTGSGERRMVVRSGTNQWSLVYGSLHAYAAAYPEDSRLQSLSECVTFLVDSVIVNDPEAPSPSE
jgi:hypothetical protein